MTIAADAAEIAKALGFTVEELRGGVAGHGVGTSRTPALAFARGAMVKALWIRGYLSRDIAEYMRLDYCSVNRTLQPIRKLVNQRAKADAEGTGSL